MTTKSAFRAKTIWGLLLMLLPVLSQALGWEWTDADTAGVENFVELALALGGAAVALWGRLTAKHKLTVLPKPGPAATNLLLGLLMLPLALAGCAGIDAVREAETPAQRAYALYGVFEGAQIVALAVVESPATPEGVKRGVQAAEAVAYEAAGALKDAARVWAGAEAELARVKAAGMAPTPERVALAAAALRALTAALAAAEPKILALRDLVARFSQAAVQLDGARRAWGAAWP